MWAGMSLLLFVSDVPELEDGSFFFRRIIRGVRFAWDFLSPSSRDGGVIDAANEDKMRWWEGGGGEGDS